MINTEHKNKCLNNIHNRPVQTGEQKILTDNPEKCSIKTRDDTMFAQKEAKYIMTILPFFLKYICVCNGDAEKLV